jgi:hypothetical protein
MRKNIRILNIFCEAAAASVDCGNKAALEGVVANINQKIKDASAKLKSEIRTVIEGTAAPKQQTMVQRFWNRINPGANNTNPNLGVLGQVQEQIKNDSEFYYDILILEAFFNKSIKRKIFNEAAGPPDARVFSIIDKSVDDFFNQFTQYVDNSISVMLNNRAAPEEAQKAINNLNHIGAATDQDAKALESRLNTFIGNATMGVLRGAEQNVQRDRNGNPLSFVKRGWNWLSGNRAANVESPQKTQAKEEKYIAAQLRNNPAMAGVPDANVTAALNYLNNFYKNKNYSKGLDLDDQLNNYEALSSDVPPDRNLLKAIHEIKNQISRNKERYGGYLGGISEAANIQMLNNYDPTGRSLLSNAITLSSKKVIEELLNDPAFKTPILSVVKCLQLKAKGLHNGPVQRNVRGNQKWLGAVDEFYYNKGHEIDQSIVTNIQKWMNKFEQKVPVNAKVDFQQALRMLDAKDQLTINRLPPDFKHVLNMGYNIQHNLPPPPAPGTAPAPQRKPKRTTTPPPSPTPTTPAPAPKP